MQFDCTPVNCVFVCEFAQSPQTCSSRLDILFTELTYQQSLLRGESSSLAHSDLTARQYSIRDLSIAPPVCSSRSPFHHAVILLSVRLHSSVIIRQKECNTYFRSTADKTLHIFQEKKHGAPEGHTQSKLKATTHLNYTIISFVVIFLSKTLNVFLCILFCQILIMQSWAFLSARDLTASSIFTITSS